MNDRKYLIATIVVAVLGIAAVRFMVSPLHARADRINAEHASLLERISGWPGEEAMLAPLRDCSLFHFYVYLARVPVMLVCLFSGQGRDATISSYTACP